MKRIIFLTILTIIATTFLFGCSLPGSEINSNNQEEPPEEKISLAGISLGDSQGKVIAVFGDQYTERYNEEPGYYGEPQLFLNYDSGLRIIIGSESKKILDILVDASEFTTGSGEKVGDNAQEVLDKYREQFDEFQGENSDGKLVGWFKVDEESLIIFDFGQF